MSRARLSARLRFSPGPGGPLAIHASEPRVRCWAKALLLLALLVTPEPALAASSAPTLAWELVTVGPSTDLFSLWGHSALCVSEGSFEQGWCFDFGVAREDDPLRLAIGTLRGQELFAIVKLPARLLLATAQFRDTWRQRIELDPVQGGALLAELDAMVQRRARYAYEPLFRNCTTELRDRLDRALSGRLREGAGARSGRPLRQLAEAGLSGQALPLALIALGGGSALDRPSSAWERMALPHGLMQALDERLSAAPSRVFSRVDAPPPTSPAAGRLVLLLVTVLGSVAFWLTVKRYPRWRSFADLALGSWLLCISLAPLIGAASALSSLHHSWMLLALTPLDALLILGRRSASWLVRYVVLRLVGLGLLGVATLAALVPSSLWLGVVLAGLPLGLWLLARRLAQAPQGGA